MSKQGRSTLDIHKYFQIMPKKMSKSQQILPFSAQKGRTFYQEQKQCRILKVNKNKINKQSELSLKYNQIKNDRNEFVKYYRIKSLICPITHLKPQDLKQFKILGVFNRKIVIGIHKVYNFFCFFDQHAMHQRIRYEFYLNFLENYGKTSMKIKQWNSQIIQKHGKYTPVISRIKHTYISYKINYKIDSQIQNDIVIWKYGFFVQYSKQTMKIKISKVPDILQRCLQNNLILKIAEQLILNDQKIPKQLESFIAEISCKSAYKFNDIIQIQRLYKIIDNLAICQYPFFCVHGRPTLFTKI